MIAGRTARCVGIWIPVSTGDQIQDESAEHHELRGGLYAEIFLEHDTDLISQAESIDTSPSARRLVHTMIAGTARWEREDIAERVASVAVDRAFFTVHSRDAAG